jgi:hypothetical protein
MQKYSVTLFYGGFNMDLNTILKNVELRKLLDESIEKTYYKYKLGFIIDKEDFKQDVYIFIIPRLKNFDNEIMPIGLPIASTTLD